MAVFGLAYFAAVYVPLKTYRKRFVSPHYKLRTEKEGPDNNPVSRFRLFEREEIPDH